MKNCHVMNRLQGLLDLFHAVDASGNTMSSATKGLERELFINQALCHVIAPPFRIGSGDVTDRSGSRSGQLDIVIEYGNSISFPLISGLDTPRLYLAEGVCLAIEVKSDLGAQWNDVVSSNQRLSILQRNYADRIIYHSFSEKIPHFAVGYRGWKSLQKAKEKLEESNLEGILTFDPPIFCSRKHQETGPEALYAFFIELQELTGSLIASLTDYKTYVFTPVQSENLA